MQRTKIIRISIYIFTGILVLAFIAYQGLGNYFNSALRKSLISGVLRESKGEYKLEIESISLNFLNRTAIFKNIHLIPLQAGPRGSEKYALSGKQLQITGIHLMDYFFKKEVLVDELIIEDPEINIYQKSVCEAKDTTYKQFSLDGLLGGKLN